MSYSDLPLALRKPLPISNSYIFFSAASIILFHSHYYVYCNSIRQSVLKSKNHKN